MKTELPGVAELPLKPADVTDMAVRARMAREAMQAVHDAYKGRAGRIRAEVASRNEGEAFQAISRQERRRVRVHETASRVTNARLAALATMGTIGREQLGPIIAAMTTSKRFYRSPADTMLRMTLDSERRSRVATSLGSAGPTELWHAAVTALQSADVELAAGIIQALRALPLDHQPFSPQAFAARFAFPPHEKAVQAINGIDRDSQAAILLWRVVQQARENPVGKVQAAMAAPVLAPADGGAVMLPEQAD